MSDPTEMTPEQRITLDNLLCSYSVVADCHHSRIEEQVAADDVADYVGSLLTEARAEERQTILTAIAIPDMDPSKMTEWDRGYCNALAAIQSVIKARGNPDASGTGVLGDQP